MKTRGFTLVELIGVIALLGILAVIVGIAVKDTVNKNKNKANIASIEKFVEIVTQNKIENGIYTDIKVLAGDKEMSYYVNGKKYILDYNGVEIDTSNANNGCAIMFLNKDGSYHVERIKINGMCYTTINEEIKRIDCKRDDMCT